MTRVFIVVLAVVLATAVIAEQELFTGVYSIEGGYNAPYVATKVDVGGKPLSLYVEDEKDYTLGIACYPVGNKASLVLRIDHPNWVRLGLKAPVGGGKSRFVICVLPGAGDAPDWCDVFTPALPVAKNVTLDGWLRFSEGGKPALRVGPSVQVGKVRLWFREDLNGGPWQGGIDLPPIYFHK